ncbi:hypothetical protein ACUM5Y_03845 [Marinomonas dokdonensis]|uniref:hypothetical protein n=1 Tax=Marinomonas dokdonensis TaxID=328224 RepID=UPI0040555D3D
MKKLAFYPVASLFLFACSSNDVQETSIGDIPEWVMSPSIENGIAVSDCTIYSGNLSIDRKQAIANARVLLAAEIESKVESLDETYTDKNQIDNESTSGTSFSSVSRQYVNQTLNGSRTLKTDIIDIDGQNNLCVMVGIEEGRTKELFDAIVKASDRKLSADDEAVLYQQFKAQQARERLDAAGARFNG